MTYLDTIGAERVISFYNSWFSFQVFVVVLWRVCGESGYLATMRYVHRLKGARHSEFSFLAPVLHVAHSVSIHYYVYNTSVSVHTFPNFRCLFSQRLRCFLSRLFISDIVPQARLVVHFQKATGRCLRPPRLDDRQGHQRFVQSLAIDVFDFFLFYHFAIAFVAWMMVGSTSNKHSMCEMNE